MTIILRPAVSDNRNAGLVTNRHRNPSIYEDRESDGVPLIDTIRFSGHVHDHHVPHWQMKKSVDANGEVEEHFTSTRARTGDFDIQVKVAHDGEMEAVIERSLPTLRYGHNIEAVDFSTAIRLVNGLYRQACEFVDWAVNVDDLRVRRLDLDRDFDGVDYLDHLLGGLARIHVPRTANTGVYTDNEHNGVALTLTRSVKHRGRTSLYDKQAQVLHIARHQKDSAKSVRLHELAAENQGRVRYEAQLRGPALLDHGVTTLSDLSEQTLLDLRERYFHRARFGTPVGGAPYVDAVIARLATSGDPDYKCIPAVLFMLKAEALNVRQPTTSSASLAKYRKLARKWGLSAADMSGLAGPPVALDFESGSLIAV